MQWKLSVEQEAYRDTLRDWLVKVAPVDAVRAWQDERDSGTFPALMAAEGWTGVGTSEELGGQGGGLVELVLTAGLLARSAAPSAGWLASVLALPALASRPEVAEAVLAGEVLTLLSPAEVLPATAPVLAVDEQGRITGSVPRVLAGDVARWLVVRVANSPELHLVDARAGGVLVERRDLLDRSRSVADLTLESVSSEPLAGAVADQILKAMSSRAAVLVAADSMGAAERMLELAVDYSLQRKQFGVAIGSFQAVKHAAADVLVGVEAARSAVYYAAASVDISAERCDLQAAAVKAQVTAEGVRAAESALTLHGAIGFTWEHDLHLFHKRTHLDQQLFGSPQVWNEVIAVGLHL